MRSIGVIIDNEFNNDIRVVNQCKIFVNNGFKVSVLCFNFGNHKNNEQIFGCNVHRISIKRKTKNLLYAFNNTIQLYNLFWAKKIKNFIKTEGIDVLHVHDLYMSKAAHLATINTLVDFTLDLHENYPAAVKGYKWMYKFPTKYFIRPWKWERIEGRYLSYAKQIVVLSTTFGQDLRTKYKFLTEDGFVVYPNIPDLKEFATYSVEENILEKNNGFILFYFGGVAERRGIYTAIEALKILNEKYKDIKLLIIGPVDKAEEETFNLKIGDKLLKDKIIYYKWKDISLLPSYINVSDICLSPIVRNAQHESGVANKVFQYMLCEKPLIVSDCTPQKEIVTTNQCGLFFKSEDADDLAQKVEKLYNNQTLRKKFGLNGKKAILGKYNSEVIGQNLIKLYK